MRRQERGFLLLCSFEYNTGVPWQDTTVSEPDHHPPPDCLFNYGKLSTPTGCGATKIGRANYTCNLWLVSHWDHTMSIQVRPSFGYIAQVLTTLRCIWSTQQLFMTAVFSNESMCWWRVSSRTHHSGCVSEANLSNIHCICITKPLYNRIIKEGYIVVTLQYYTCIWGYLGYAQDHMYWKWCPLSEVYAFA